MAKSADTLDASDWYADSGASAHMSGEITYFSSYQQFPTAVKILGHNSGTLDAIGSGTVSFTSELEDGQHETFDLVNVYYVPGIVANLVSLMTVVRKGVKVSMKHTKSLAECNLYYNDAPLARGIEQKSSGLFELQIRPIIRTALLSKVDRSLEDWHRTLGHVGVHQVLKMAREDCVSGMRITNSKETVNCGECPAGKATHASHPISSRQRATLVGEIVHLDLIGPINPTSLGGNKYILLFTDEYSNYRASYSL